MKVAMVSPNPPWFPGGVERHVGELAKRLKKKVDIEIYCTSLEKEDLEVCEWQSIPVHVFHTRGATYHYSRKLSRCLNESRDHDILHAHGFTTYMPLASMKAKPKKGFVFTPHYHPVGSTTVLSAARKLYDPVLGARILKSADRLICVSSTEANLICEKYPQVEDKITVIPSGVDVARLRNARPYEMYGSMVLYAGRLEGYKNVDILVRSMKYMPGDIELYIIGSGPAYDELVTLEEELDIEQDVHFMGYVPDTDLDRWRATCDVFINLSDVEAFGSTVIEAVAAGRHVVVNRKLSLNEFETAFPELVHGIDVHKEGPRKLAELIKKVINTSKRSGKITLDLSAFDWKNVCKKTLGLYKDL